MATRDNLIFMKKKRETFDFTLKALPAFAKAMDKHWKARSHKYRSRTHFVFSVIAKAIKWDKEF